MVSAAAAGVSTPELPTVTVLHSPTDSGVLIDVIGDASLALRSPRSHEDSGFLGGGRARWARSRQATLIPLSSADDLSGDQSTTLDPC